MKIINILFNILNFVELYANECNNCIYRQMNGENIDCTNLCSDSILQDCLDYTICREDSNLIKEFDVCYCEVSELSCNEYLCPNIKEFETDLIGYSRYEFSLILKNNAQNIYAIYGDSYNVMIVPEAYQVNQNVNTNVNVGGMNNIILKVYPESIDDSWFTIQITDGSMNNQVSSIGINFNDWTATSGMIINDGAIFLNDPLIKLINTNKFVIAHLTLKNNKNHKLIINVDGKLNLSDEYARHHSSGFRINNITFNIPVKSSA